MLLIGAQQQIARKPRALFLAPSSPLLSTPSTTDARHGYRSKLGIPLEKAGDGSVLQPTRPVQFVRLTSMRLRLAAMTLAPEVSSKSHAAAAAGVQAAARYDDGRDVRQPPDDLQQWPDEVAETQWGGAAARSGTSASSRRAVSWPVRASSRAVANGRCVSGVLPLIQAGDWCGLETNGSEDGGAEDAPRGSATARPWLH